MAIVLCERPWLGILGKERHPTDKKDAGGAVSGLYEYLAEQIQERNKE